MTQSDDRPPSSTGVGRLSGLCPVCREDEKLAEKPSRGWGARLIFEYGSMWATGQCETPARCMRQGQRAVEKGCRVPGHWAARGRDRGGLTIPDYGLGTFGLIPTKLPCLCVPQDQQNFPSLWFT